MAQSYNTSFVRGRQGLRPLLCHTKDLKSDTCSASLLGIYKLEEGNEC